MSRTNAFLIAAIVCLVAVSGLGYRSLESRVEALENSRWESRLTPNLPAARPQSHVEKDGFGPVRTIPIR
jgi:hypothetical protein